MEHWINDGLMAIFFLLIGLELEREIYVGELSDFKNARFPIFAAIGGMVVPAGIFLLLNFGTQTKNGAGIPMATDIAFALGILSLLGSRVPTTLKVFLTALAVIDDLGAILVIAIFYTTTLSLTNLFIALGIYAVLLFLNFRKVYNLIPNLVGGAAMWYFMLHSEFTQRYRGTFSIAIPFRKGVEQSPSYRLQHFYINQSHFYSTLVALANTCITLGQTGRPIHANSVE